MARAPRLDTEIPQGERRGPARLDLHLPLALKRAVAMAAAERGVPLGELVLEALRRHPDVSKHVERFEAEGG